MKTPYLIVLLSSYRCSKSCLSRIPDGSSSYGIAVSRQRYKNCESSTTLGVVLEKQRNVMSIASFSLVAVVELEVKMCEVDCVENP